MKMSSVASPNSTHSDADVVCGRLIEDFRAVSEWDDLIYEALARDIALPPEVVACHVESFDERARVSNRGPWLDPQEMPWPSSSSTSSMNGRLFRPEELFKEADM